MFIYPEYYFVKWSSTNWKGDSYCPVTGSAIASTRLGRFLNDTLGIEES